MKKPKLTRRQLEHVRSCNELFQKRNRLFIEARAALDQYKDIPKEMTREEWDKAVEALSQCFASVKTTFLIARSVSGFSDINRLYASYYDGITNHLLEKLELLIKWSGTGLDIAAGYDAHLLERIASYLIDLLISLDMIHRKEIDASQDRSQPNAIEDFREKTRESFSNPGVFCASCDSYVKRRVVIKQCG